jgi:FKBP-type peptidyl-prolyl cis-trans isomerase
MLAASPRLARAQAEAQPPREIDTVHFAPALGVDLAHTKNLGGAYVRDLTTGTGRRAAHGNVVTIRMEAWRTDGSLLSADSTNLFSFKIGGATAMRGIDQGVIGMLEGGRRQIVVPPQAQGSSGIPGVPLGATVVFVVELLAARDG